MDQKQPNRTMFQTFLSYSIPCIIGMFLTSFITVVDGMFIGWKMGGKGLAAVNLTLPVLYVLLALTIMIGVGGVTLASQSLGGKDRDQANRHFTCAFIVSLGVNLIITLFLALFLDRVIELLHASGVLTGLVKDYLGTMRFFYPFMMLNLTFSMFIRSEGKPQLSLFFGIAGNIINTVLDYIFIMNFGWGMRGAALASGLSVFIPFVCGLFYFCSPKSVFKFQTIRFTWAGLRQMLFLGSAEFVAQISVSVSTYIFNWILLRRIGINGVAALTVVGYVLFIQNMILSGVAVGIHPVISYHFGAKDKKSILEMLSLALKAVIIAGGLIYVITFLASSGIAGLFAKDNPELASLVKSGLRLYLLAFFLNGYNMIAAAYFTSLGNAKAAAVISVLRSFVLINGFILILPYFMGNNGIWLTAPLTELVTFAVSFLWVKESRNQLHFDAVTELTPV